MSALLSKNVQERALWTGAQALAALGITVLGGVSVWWAAPLAVVLSAVKTNILDRMAARKEVAGESGP